MNFDPQIFGVLQPCQRAFERCQNMWTKVRQLRESGVFRFCTHIAISFGNARFFSPRDAPDF